MEKIMSKERFVARFMADQEARKGAQADFDGAEVSKEALEILSEMERKMQLAIDREFAGYAAEMAKARRAKEAKKQLRRPRRFSR